MQVEEIYENTREKPANFATRGFVAWPVRMQDLH